jgi:hypothetical protein
VGIGFLYRPARLQTGGIHSLESISGLHKRLKIRALYLRGENRWPVIYLCRDITHLCLACAFLYELCIIMYIHTDKKENRIFLIYREIQSGAVAKVIYD